MVTFSRPIIVIAGSTASGKSNIAIKLAKDINGVIINADSDRYTKNFLLEQQDPLLRKQMRFLTFCMGTSR